MDALVKLRVEQNALPVAKEATYSQDGSFVNIRSRNKLSLHINPSTLNTRAHVYRPKTIDKPQGPPGTFSISWRCDSNFLVAPVKSSTISPKRHQ